MEELRRRRQQGIALVLVVCFWTLLAVIHGELRAVPEASAQTGEQEESAENIEAIGDSGIEVRLDSIASGLVAPLLLTQPDDGSGRRFIVDQPGQIRILESDNELLEEPFLDLSDRIIELEPAYDERGLLGLAFHPDYQENGRFFVYYSAEPAASAPPGWDNTSHISEFTVSEDDPDRADPESERLILTVDQPFENHNGGQIRFGDDGYLYIPLGDGGNGGDIDPEDDDRGRPARGNAQTPGTPLGSVLRIDVDAAGDGGSGRAYGIPPDNPFVDEPGRAEIWAYGLRNPYGFSRDLETGDFYAAEAGQALFEEMNLIEGGGNYGWNIREGTACFNTENFTQPLDDCRDRGYRGEPLVDPVAQYRRSPDTGSVVVPGIMYRGDELSELEGKLVFGDYSRIRFRPEGVIYTADPEAGERPWPVSEVRVSGDRDATADGRLTRFLLGISQDLDGEIYAMTTSIGGPDEPEGAGEIFAIRTPEAESSARPAWQWAVLAGALMLVVLAAIVFFGAAAPTPLGGGKGPMRVAGAVALAAALGTVLCGFLVACGGDHVDPQGDPVAGEEILTGTPSLAPSCGACHTLKAAEFEGEIGPDLDRLRPGYEQVYRAVHDGPGAMPAYRDRLSGRELHDVAAYVSHVAGSPGAAESLADPPEGGEAGG